MQGQLFPSRLRKLRSSGVLGLRGREAGGEREEREGEAGRGKARARREEDHPPESVRGGEKGGGHLFQPP